MGDWVSPKKEPHTTAPATMGAGMPRPMPMPMNATPMVPAVVHEEPIRVLIKAHRTTVKGSSHWGEKIFRPQ